MITCSKRFALACSLLLLSLGSGLAQPPEHVEFGVTNESTRVWDLSGDLTLAQDFVGASAQGIPLTFTLASLSQDASGRLSGSGTIFVDLGANPFVADYKASGKVSGGGGNPTRVSLQVRLTGEDVVAGVLTKFKISINYHLEVISDSEGTRLSGSAKGSVKFTQLGTSGRVDSQIEPDLPSNMDGNWTVALDIVPGKPLAGTGTIVLSNNRPLSTHLKGSFNPSLDSSSVTLTGFDGSKGTKLSLKFITIEGVSEITDLHGKILGQTVKE